MTSSDSRTNSKSKADAPIKSLEEDRLGYGAYAKKFLNHLYQDVNYSEGLVVGLNGAWGSGKTSFLNLLKIEIGEGYPVVELNPWGVSDGSSIKVLEYFATEMSSQLESSRESKVRELGKGIKHITGFIQKFAPVASVTDGIGGAIVSVVTTVYNTVAETFRSQCFSPQEREKRIRKKFSRLDSPIFVFIDEVDRLNREEIKEIFKLIRQTAHLPNLIYVIALDMGLVAEAIDEPGVPGSLYMQKIIQTEITLPTVGYDFLIDEFYKRCILMGEEEEDKRGDLPLYKYLVGSINNIRDVKRVEQSIDSDSENTKYIDKYELALMEVIKYRAPQTYSNIRNYVQKLCNESASKVDDRQPFSEDRKSRVAIDDELSSKLRETASKEGVLDIFLLLYPKLEDLESYRRHPYGVSRGQFRGLDITLSYFAKKPLNKVIRIQKHRDEISASEDSLLQQVEKASLGELKDLLCSYEKVEWLTATKEKVVNLFTKIIERIEYLWENNQSNYSAHQLLVVFFGLFLRNIISEYSEDGEILVSTEVKDSLISFTEGRSYSTRFFVSEALRRNALNVNLEKEIFSEVKPEDLDPRKEWNYWECFKKLKNNSLVEELTPEIASAIIKSSIHVGDKDTLILHSNDSLYKELGFTEIMNKITPELQKWVKENVKIESAREIIPSNNAVVCYDSSR